ncbi:MAG: Gfo/Idh/MocA family oxidoreductase [Treponema sp.]|jgi:predicted dehydrogenase|nr:Gfo/Idh/MocA family oxidoreductase [Treponema sp.]
MIKMGVIGMGIRGTMFADTIGQNQYAELAAFTEYDDSTRERISAAYPVPGYKDFKTMIDREKLDAVIVATPDFLHRDAVIYAAEKNVNILCEKPFSTSAEECGEMAAAIKKNKVKCLVAFENHWNLPFVSAKNEIESGAIGDILNINCHLNDTIFVPTELLPWARKGSSVGWFLFPHMVDAISWFTGKTVESVYAVGTKKKLLSMGINLYDTIQTVLNFTDGTHSTISSSWVLPNSMPLIYDLKIEIIGEEGALYIDTNNQMLRKGNAGGYSHVHTLGTAVNGLSTGGPNFMLHYFVDALRNNTPIEANERAGLINTQIVYAIHKSLESGRIEQVQSELVYTVKIGK